MIHGDKVIQLEKASVCYRVQKERINSFKEYAINWIQGKIKTVNFWALRDVNLEIYKGDTFGIIGNNGAGKSTMLKLISRVIKPSEGRVWVKGYVAPLLELGAGFHPELSGRENVFLNGAMLGFTHLEMQHKLEPIIEFSELRDFIDAPMRTYSSGMWARLGFAVATDSQPDILIVDEILSVGDEAFQNKCMARIKEYSENGTTILLVSHSAAMIESMCNRAVWIDHGIVKKVGIPKEVIKNYRTANKP
jgi:ABC-2 type transport system ATP-binding protein